MCIVSREAEFEAFADWYGDFGNILSSVKVKTRAGQSLTGLYRPFDDDLKLIIREVSPRCGIYLPIAEMSVPVEQIFMVSSVVGFLSGMLGIGGGFFNHAVSYLYRDITVRCGRNARCAACSVQRCWGVWPFATWECGCQNGECDACRWFWWHTCWRFAFSYAGADGADRFCHLCFSILFCWAVLV